MAMAPYILYESPGMPVGDVLQASNELMKGNKMRLFCMHLSFIGWALLCAIFTANQKLKLITTKERIAEKRDTVALAIIIQHIIFLICL